MKGIRGLPTEAALDRLRSLDEDAPAVLRDALGHKSPHVVAMAATQVGERELGTHGSALEAAFTDRMRDPVKRDPGCVAKIAIVEALLALDLPARDVYRAGVRYVQMEPAWGKPVDTAIPVRVACAHGLAGLIDDDIWPDLVDLLADESPLARSGAARAIAARGERPIGALLLRLKVHAGDKEPDVTGDAMAALLDLDPTTLDFVAGRLADEDQAIREGAALAIGGSRHPGALPHLARYFDGAEEPRDHKAALVAIAMLRDQAARKLLLDLVAEGAAREARAAIAALAIHAHDPDLAAAVREAAARNEADLADAVAAAFRD